MDHEADDKSGPENDYEVGTQSDSVNYHEVDTKDSAEADKEYDNRHERLNNRMTLRDAWDREHEYIPLDSAPGRVAGDFVNLYPPGIPLVVPGEEITEDLIKVIKESLNKGLNVQGIEQKSLIRVVA